MGIGGRGSKCDVVSGRLTKCVPEQANILHARCPTMQTGGITLRFKHRKRARQKEEHERLENVGIRKTLWSTLSGWPQNAQASDSPSEKWHNASCVKNEPFRDFRASALYSDSSRPKIKTRQVSIATCKARKAFSMRHILLNGSLPQKDQTCFNFLTTKLPRIEIAKRVLETTQLGRPRDADSNWPVTTKTPAGPG